MNNNSYSVFRYTLICILTYAQSLFSSTFEIKMYKKCIFIYLPCSGGGDMKCIHCIQALNFSMLLTSNNVAYLHLPFFLAMSNPAEERHLCSSTGGKTIPLGFALPVSSQMRQKKRKIKGENHYSLNEMSWV